MTIDVSAPHVYAVDWQADRVEFRIDGATVRETEQAPDYPMMLILGLFDFPAMPGDPADVPELRVTRVTATDARC